MNGTVPIGRSGPLITTDDAVTSQAAALVSRTRLFWLLHAVGWTAFGIAMFAWGLDFMRLRDALVNKCLLVAIGALLTLLFRLIFQSLRAGSVSGAIAVFASVAVSFAGALLWRETHSLLFQGYFSWRTIGSIRVELRPISLGTFLYDGFVLLAWSLLYLAITNWMELELQRERTIRADAMARAARLQALQSQLEPHFLFNTLNAISSLVIEGKNADAERMITLLSNFLRLTLAKNGTPEIALAEELEFVRNYLEIERVRFGERLRVSIEADPEAMNGRVPALVLQPLIENAVKHGVLACEEGGSLAVSAARNNGSLRLTVADSGPGMAKDCTSRGVGLRNTVGRLRELYGDASSISMGRCTGGGLEVTIEIPFRAGKAPVSTAKGSSS